MWEFTEEALQILVKKFVEKLKAAVAAKRYPYGWPDEKGQSNKIATGNLYNSITGTVEIDEQGNPVAVIEYLDYFKYVNRGRRPNARRVPLNVLLDWISIRGIRPRDNRGRFVENNLANKTKLAFGIQTNIFKYGIRPTNIYDIGLDDLENMFSDFPNNLPSDLRGPAENILREAVEDINNFIENTIEIETITIRPE
jgi:hypothetical protein